MLRWGLLAGTLVLLGTSFLAYSGVGGVYAQEAGNGTTPSDDIPIDLPTEPPVEPTPEPEPVPDPEPQPEPEPVPPPVPTITTHTGTIALDRSIYPLPWGAHGPNSHRNSEKDLTIYVTINDPDHDLTSGTDTISTSLLNVKIDKHGTSKAVDTSGISIREARPGIFETAVQIPSSAGNDECQYNNDFKKCILKDSKIVVEYTDDTNVDGNTEIIKVSAGFTLTDGKLKTDKSEYDYDEYVKLQLTEADFNLDSKKAERHPLHIFLSSSGFSNYRISDRINYCVSLMSEASGSSIFKPSLEFLRETGPNTGVFEIKFKLPEQIGRYTTIKPGQEVDISYTDYGTSSSSYVGKTHPYSWRHCDSGDAPPRHGHEITIKTTDYDSTIKFDKDEYSWNDEIILEVTSPEYNFNPNSIETIGSGTNPKASSISNPLTISSEYYYGYSYRPTTPRHSLDAYELRETGPDTGVFKGKVQLVGYGYDADGDPETEHTKKAHVYGTGPDDGKLPVLGTDLNSDRAKIIAKFGFSNSRTVESVPIKWSLGVITWDSSNPTYDPGDHATFRITDADMNLDPIKIDKIKVSMKSESYDDGIDMEIDETANDSGIFEGSIVLSADSSGHAKIKVQPGGWIEVTYKDHTVARSPRTVSSIADISGGSEPEPEPKKCNDGAVLKDGICVQSPPPADPAPKAPEPEPKQPAPEPKQPTPEPKQPAPEPKQPTPEPRQPASGQMAISDPRITNSLGKKLAKVDSGELVQLTATFENKGDKYQAFTYVADIQRGSDLDKMHLTTQLAPKTSANSGLSWTPEKSGTYKVTLYAKPSVNSNENLAKPVSLTFVVGGQLPATEKLSLGRPSLGDETIKSGKKVDITSKITNNQDRNQRHVYIVQVTDSSGTVVHITWAVEDVAADGTFSPSVSWTPQKPGKYEVKTFVWSSLVNNPQALAPPNTTTVVVG